MCGSGTFVIEAAMIAADIAPGLGRNYFGFLGWRQHDAALWDRLRAEASARVRSSDDVASIVRGHDRDTTAIRAAKVNAQRARVDELVRFAVQPLAEARPAQRGVGPRSEDAAALVIDAESAAASTSAGGETTEPTDASVPSGPWAAAAAAIAAAAAAAG